ncbi:MAG: DUF4421 domain-containing protein [Bacteroidales bacterium]|nr:DUF4421 domain-containing protein [Bacteroidales bacterium]
MLRFLLPISLLLASFSAAGQQKDSFLRDLDSFFQMRADKTYAKMDSNYVGRYPYRWDVRPFTKTSGLQIVTEGPTSAHLSSGVSNRIGVGIDYRGFGFGLTKTIGKSRGTDLALNSYGRHFCFEYSLHIVTSSKGTVELPTDSRRPDNGLVFISNKLNLFYSFNQRFSLGAAMKQSNIQKRSAGSFLAAVTWSAWDIAAMGERGLFTRAEFIRANYFQNRFSIGAGYGYNLVFGHQRWLVHASAVPMWTVHEMNSYRQFDQMSRDHYPFGWISFAGTVRAAVSYRWGTRWSVGVSGTTDQMISHNSRRKLGSGDVYTRFGSSEWQVTASLLYRF